MARACASRVPPLAQRLLGIPHRLVSPAEGFGNLAGQVAELLHHLAERAAQGALAGGVPLGLGAVGGALLVVALRQRAVR